MWSVPLLPGALEAPQQKPTPGEPSMPPLSAGPQSFRQLFFLHALHPHI